MGQERGQKNEKTERLLAVEVIICMIIRDFSVISMTSQASPSLSLLPGHND